MNNKPDDLLPLVGLMNNSRQLDVILYIFEHTNPSNGLYIGTVRATAEAVGASLSTVTTTMKQLQTADIITKKHNGVYMIKGDVRERNRLIIKYKNIKQEEELNRKNFEKIEKESKKSVFTNPVQINLDYTKQFIQLMGLSQKAAQIFAFLVEHMDDYNALVCPSAVIQESLGMSSASVTRAVKVLKDNKFIDIKKTGTTNVYLINSELVWKSRDTNYKYAEFNAKMLNCESENKEQNIVTRIITTAEIVDKK